MSNLQLRAIWKKNDVSPGGSGNPGGSGGSENPNNPGGTGDPDDSENRNNSDNRDDSDNQDKAAVSNTQTPSTNGTLGETPEPTPNTTPGSTFSQATPLTPPEATPYNLENIGDGDTLGAPCKSSLLSLILSALAIVGTIMLLIGADRRRRREPEDTNAGGGRLTLTFATIAGVITPAIYILLDFISSDFFAAGFTLINRWTVFVAAAFATHAAFAVASLISARISRPINYLQPPLETD
jgi:hypothetical protein